VPGEPYSAVWDGVEPDGGPSVTHSGPAAIPPVPIAAIQSAFGGLTYLRIVPPGVGTWHLLGLAVVVYLGGVACVRRLLRKVGNLYH
jgi:hypothetical protein